MTLVKICGLKTVDSVMTCIDVGADYIGLNFFPKSPRYVTAAEAYELALPVPDTMEAVGLFVNPDDAVLDEYVSQVALDIIQLHGDETPDRVAAIREKYQRKIMKVLPVATADDLKAVPIYEPVSDLFLFDAKAPKGAVLPGGNGVPFDWTLLETAPTSKPWMLAGGLTPLNVSEAIRLTGAPAVDVSSGVESAPGEKDAEKIKAFVEASRAA